MWAVCAASSSNAAVTVITNFGSGWPVSGVVSSSASMTAAFTNHVFTTHGLRYRSDAGDLARR